MSYTEKEYADKAVEATSKGEMLYIIVTEETYDVEVPVFETVQEEQEQIKLDENGMFIPDDDGNPVMETVTVNIEKPVMIEKEVPIFDENGEQTGTNTILVQQTRTETLMREVENLVIAPAGYYICYKDNYTHGEINEEYEAEQAEKNKNYLIEEVNYPLKAKVAYTGVRFDYQGQELVFETNETSISMINFTAMMAQQSGLSNISNWKCRKTIEPFEPVSITFTTEQFQKLIAFASQMVLQAFAVEEQINQKIQALSVEQLNNPLVLQKTKQQMELAYNNVPVKLEDLFANS